MLLMLTLRHLSYEEHLLLIYLTVRSRVRPVYCFEYSPLLILLSYTQNVL